MKKEERFQRYKYLTGLSSWEIASYQEPNFKVIMNDGPSGLRKPVSQDFHQQDEVYSSVCLPTPAALAASFDEELCYKNGKLLALSCLYYNTNILLAPGVNLKRNALCGRNFEYFSEDPYLAGKLASQYINGLEDSGVGACVKHYACNSQEFARRINSSEVSLRTLNEIYLRVFKYIFKYSKPTAVMTSYNRINGEYINESDYLINKKLRQEYCFNGLIMSDWNAVSNKWETIKTGLNIEMPLSKLSYESVDLGFNKIFTEQDLIDRDNEMYKAIQKFKKVNKTQKLNLDEIHEEAIDVANRTMVLLKNENKYFPINQEEKVLLLGYFANHNNYVGGGSGWVKAHKAKSLIEVMDEHNADYDFIEAYDENSLKITKDELAAYQNNYSKVIVMLGQYPKDERGEGGDRQSLELDENQQKLLSMVKEVFGHFGVVVISGSVVNLEKVYQESNALFLTYLAGECQADAIYNNLYGINNPSGHLPETWISSIYQNPIYQEYLRRDIYHTYYIDDIYVGYRYYDIYKNGFIMPFGYGLSYSEFKYDDFEVDVENNSINVSLSVENISDIGGRTLIQVYIGKKGSSIYRPIKELKGFNNFYVEKHTKDKLEIKIDIDDIKSYNEATDAFELEDGEYQVYIAKSADEILNIVNINLSGIKFEESKLEELPVKDVPTCYTINSPLGLLFDNVFFKKYVSENNLDIETEDLEEKFWYAREEPLRCLVTENYPRFNISFNELEKLIAYLNTNDTNMYNQINFDSRIGKHIKILKW